jgi:hypothetical protein
MNHLQSKLSRPARSPAISRRQFLVSTTGLLLLPSARMARAYPANERLNVAVFGTMYNSEHFLTGIHSHNASIVAVCNADQRKFPTILKKWEETANRLEASDNPNQRQAAAQYRRKAGGAGVKFYSDIRRMLDEMSGSIDALVVSEFDHLHGVACGRALRAGKPVCSERPIGLTISDARGLRALAAETKLPTTYRSPGTGGGQLRRALELVEDGAIGEVKEVHFWFKRGGPDRDSLPVGKQVVPEELNWDLWLGPLPWRDYHPDWMAYSHWRETCNGGLGVFGPHTGIFPFLALKMRSLWDASAAGTLIRVTAECSRLNRVSFPRWERIRWEIPARGEMAPVTVTWHHGPEFAPGSRELIHDKLRSFGVQSGEEAGDLMRNAGSMLIGSEGALVGDDHSVRVTALPKARFEKIETNRPLRIPSSHGIYGDWMSACRGGTPHILANFDHGGPLSELLMLGNIATLFPEETLAYDPVSGRITNKPEANEKLGFNYREGWEGW